MLLGLWLMDGEILAHMGTLPEDQLGPFCYLLKLRCLWNHQEELPGRQLDIQVRCSWELQTCHPEGRDACCPCGVPTVLCASLAVSRFPFWIMVIFSVPYIVSQMKSKSKGLCPIAQRFCNLWKCSYVSLCIIDIYWRVLKNVLTRLLIEWRGKGLQSPAVALGVPPEAPASIYFRFCLQAPFLRYGLRRWGGLLTWRRGYLLRAWLV